jgi:hypothetical protein
MSILGVSNPIGVGSTVNFVSSRDFYIYSGLFAASTTGTTFVDINLPQESAKLKLYLTAGSAASDNIFWQISLDGSEVARVCGRYGNANYGELPTLELTLVSSGDTKLLIKGLTTSGDFNNCSVVVMGRTLNA